MKIYDDMIKFFNKYKWLFLILIIQIFLTNYFIPLSEILNNRIIYNNDYPYSYLSTLQTAYAFSKLKLDFYYPYFAGGSNVKDYYLNYFVSDKLLVSFFMICPLYSEIIFKIYIFIVNLIIPFLIYLSAKNFDFKGNEALTASFMSLIFWNFEPWIKTMNHTGIIFYLFSTIIVILAISYSYKYFKKGGIRNLEISFILVAYALSMYIISLILIVFYIMIILCSFLKKNKILFSMFLILIIIFFISLYLFVSSPSFSYTPYRFKTLTSSGFYAIIQDVSSIYIKFIFLFGFCGICIFYKEKNKAKFVLFLIISLSLFFYTYFGSFLNNEIINYTSPRRFIITLTIFLIFPATKTVITLFNYLMKNFNMKFLLTLIIVFILIFYFNLNVIKKTYDYYYNIFENNRIGTESPPDVQNLITWLKTNTTSTARVLIEDSSIFSGYGYGGTIISVFPIKTQREFIGGPYPSEFYKGEFFQNFYDGMFLGRNISSFSPNDMNKIFNLYNIKWIMAYTNESKNYFDNHPKLVKKNKNIGNFYIYTTNIEPSFFIKGNGNLKPESDRIKIENATKGEIILKYNYVENLQTSPKLKVSYENINVSDFSLKFIKIYNGATSEFEIFI